MVDHYHVIALSFGIWMRNPNEIPKQIYIEKKVIIISSTYAAVKEGLVERAHVEVQPLIDDGPQLGVSRIEGAALPSVGGDQVGGCGAALADDKVAVNKDRDGMLRVQLENHLAYVHLKEPYVQ